MTLIQYFKVQVNKVVGQLLWIFRCSFVDNYIQKLLDKQGIAVEIEEYNSKVERYLK